MNLRSARVETTSSKKRWMRLSVVSLVFDCLLVVCGSPPPVWHIEKSLGGRSLLLPWQHLENRAQRQGAFSLDCFIQEFPELLPAFFRPPWEDEASRRITFGPVS